MREYLRIGADRVLYGTDTPLYFAPSQRARINYAGISDAEKLLILRENAIRLLDLSPLMETAVPAVVRGPPAGTAGSMPPR